jgi:ABC-type sugar transport system substrate-binding protein
MAKSTTKRILLITSTIAKGGKAIDSIDYFASIVSELAVELQAKFPEIELIVKVPDSFEKAHDIQVSFLETAIRNEASYDFIVLSPFDKVQLYEKLPEWKDFLNKGKLILIDQAYTDQEDDYKVFHKGNIRRPAYVQADWKTGGRMAGEILIEYFNDQKITCPHIVILHGKIGSLQRVNGLKEIIDSKSSPEFHPMYIEFKCDYSKDIARTKMNEYLKNCIKSNRHIDAVFTTNDEMALGARAAMFENQKQYEEKIFSVSNNRYPKIVGFDGIRDVTLFIDIKDHFILNTISVGLQHQIKKLVSIMQKIYTQGNIESVPESQKFILHQCEPYKKFKTS